MSTPKTHFEQIPVKLLKAVIERNIEEQKSVYVANSMNSRRAEVNSPQSIPTCSICGNQVALETCNTDECGQPLHEDCAVSQLKANTGITARAKLTSHRGSYSQTKMNIQL